MVYILRVSSTLALDFGANTKSKRAGIIAEKDGTTILPDLRFQKLNISWLVQSLTTPNLLGFRCPTEVCSFSNKTSRAEVVFLTVICMYTKQL